MEALICFGVVAGVFSVLLAAATAWISGDCSRQEEEEERKRMKDGN